MVITANIILIVGIAFIVTVGFFAPWVAMRSLDKLKLPPKEENGHN